ncbi:MAG: hypothetical protein K8T89_26625, partial [Planctomycetes bacterium]|nr:hypothetical protein [Planctomycetota bacterium]
MWTPRRMILVAVGVLLFGGGFTLYSQLFGWIDGLPPLPDTYSQEQVDGAKVPELPGGTTPIQTRLRQAFGPNCVEQAYNLKFEAREKGLLFAASDAKILEDGRVLLQQMSIAVFGKVNREISTIHADRAWLTFEKPVSKLDDMGTNKLKSAELQADPDFPTSDVRKGKIHIINNRRTADPDDDMILRTPGPLYYREEPKSTEPHIWTLNSVELVDRQNRPLPSQKDAQVSLPTVTAEGLRVFLTPEPPKSPAGTPPKKLANSPSDSRGGVDRIELDRNVLMNIWTESRNMLGGGNEKNDASKAPVPKKATVQPADKVLLTIQTNGPFYYDMIKDFAHFEVPAQRDPNIQEYVKVTRRSKGTSEDTLTSDFLDVQFKRRRAATPTTPGQPPPKPVPVAKSPDGSTSSENDLDIETMHAWGKNIAVSSDEESLFAYGFDLVYDARIKQTTIKGAPMHAVKEGNLIRAPELIMANLDDKEKQHARARGPGVVGMGEFDPKTQEHGRQAYWQDWLIFTKVKEQGRDLDLITLSGSARFIDTLNEQKLNGRVLKLWMISRDDKNAPKQP